MCVLVEAVEESRVVPSAVGQDRIGAQRLVEVANDLRHLTPDKNTSASARKDNKRSRNNVTELSRLESRQERVSTNRARSDVTKLSRNDSREEHASQLDGREKTTSAREKTTSAVERTPTRTNTSAQQALLQKGRQEAVSRNVDGNKRSVTWTGPGMETGSA